MSLETNKEEETETTKKTMNSCDRADEVSPLSSILENDLVSKILSNLPVKSLMQAKCVCKSWRSLIESDPHFMYLHLTRSKTRPSVLISNIVSSSQTQSATSFSSAYLFEVIDHGEAAYNVTAYNVTAYNVTADMLKPVNGLICFIRHLELEVLIYNLSTREQTPWIKTTMTTIDINDKSWYGRQYYEFGFDSTTKEHKVLRVFIKDPGFIPGTDHFRTDDDFCEVLTVGPNSWRKIDQVPPYKICGDGFYANGALYWLCNSGDQYSYPDSDCIVVFDVGSEKFIRVIPIPSFICQSRSLYWTSVLLNVDGRPALLGTSRTDDHKNDVTIKMWILDDGDVNWIEETISLPFEEKPVWLKSFEAIEGTDLIIIQSNRKTMEPVLSVYYYDRKKKTWTAPPRGGLTIKNAPPCVGLFTLDSPSDRIPFNYNISYVISTFSFTESLFPVQQQQQQRPSSLGVDYEAATLGSSSDIHMLLGA